MRGFIAQLRRNGVAYRIMALHAEIVHGLAQKLLERESAGMSASDLQALGGERRMLEKLRRAVALFAGEEGATALFRRALAIAKEEIPALHQLSVSGDKGLQGLEKLAVDYGGRAAASVITEHLLSLLITFVGESLTIRLVHDAWPDESFEDLTLGRRR